MKISQLFRPNTIAKSLAEGNPLRVRDAYASPHGFHVGMYQLWRSAKRVVWSNPAIYWIFGVAVQRRNVFADNYDVLVEGFFRSANTYTESALCIANPCLRVLCHMHCPVFVRTAIYHHKPVVVLVRQPVDAITSYALFSRLPLSSAIQAYVDYYSHIERVASSVTVIDFTRAVTQIDDVIEEINERYHLHLATSARISEFKKRVRERVEKYEWSIDPLKISLPSDMRGALAAEIKRLLTGGLFDREMQRANELYGSILLHARPGKQMNDKTRRMD